MKCPECVAEDLRSCVYPRGSTSTLMGGGGPYWNEDGVLHVHDPNKTTTRYQCTEGHEWVESKLTPCPAKDCDYGKSDG